MKKKISELKLNPNNPRFIRDEKFEKLKKSLQNFPEMMEARPVVIDENNVILGGNMRYRAAKELGWKQVEVKVLKGLTENQKREFIIKDNAAYGEWDWELLANEWELELLKDAAINIPTVKNTELLSKLEYKSIYFEPKQKKEIKLHECIDTSIYSQKMQAIQSLGLTKEQIEVLRLFAYRFIKINFQRVAEYYFWHASEEEKLAIERLRLVLVDNGINGFIEDQLLKLIKNND